MKTVQTFSDEYLKESAKLSPDEILQFLEDFKKLQDVKRKVKTKLISIKVEQDLLELFRSKCELEGSRYQTKIKELMKEWL